MYILHANTGNGDLIIDKLKNNNVLLYYKFEGTVFPLVKCKLSRLSFIFSHPNEVIDSHATILDHHSTECVIRNIIGDKDSRNCKLYKPTCMMYYKVCILILENKYVLSFKTYFNVWKKKKNQSGNNTYDDMITTDTITTEYILTAKEFIKILTHINIFNKNIADDLIERAFND